MSPTSQRLFDSLHDNWEDDNLWLVFADSLEDDGDNRCIKVRQLVQAKEIARETRKKKSGWRSWISANHRLQNHSVSLKWLFGILTIQFSPIFSDKNKQSYLNNIHLFELIWCDFKTKKDIPKEIFGSGGIINEVLRQIAWGRTLNCPHLAKHRGWEINLVNSLLLTFKL